MNYSVGRLWVRAPTPHSNFTRLIALAEALSDLIDFRCALLAHRIDRDPSKVNSRLEAGGGSIAAPYRSASVSE